MRINLLVALLITMLATTSFTRYDDRIQLDGVINENEWKESTKHVLANGGEILIKKISDELYVAIRGERKGWVHVYLLQHDTITVLHASAALGKARYVKNDRVWKSIQAFEWDMRDRTYNNNLEERQGIYYKQYGWVANNNNTGNGMSFEFRIDLSRCDRPPRFAAVFIDESMSLHHFPSSLKDHTVLPRLVQGYTPDSLQFNPPSWEIIR